MTITVYDWAKDVEDQNLLILLWFIRKVGLHNKDARYIDKKTRKKFLRLGFYPDDISTILRSKSNGNDIAKKNRVEDHVRFGYYHGNETVVEMDLGHTADVEITDQSNIEMFCYLSGCLNNNLIEHQRPPKFFHIGKAVRSRFRWATSSKYVTDGDEE